MYYDDPVLTFEDSMIYGCTLEFDLSQLQDFCSNYKWKNLMIFQNLFQLTNVGKSGNSNPNWENDWIDIEIDEEKDKKFHNVDPQLDRRARFCSFPSTRVVDIFYQKIEEKENPQFIITRMQHYQEKSPYRWEFTNPKDDTK